MQIVNFLILLFVLKKFLYKPILGMLEKRREMIEKSMKDAERIEGEMARIKEARDEILRRANGEAEKLIQEGRDLAESKKASVLKIAEKEANILLFDARKALEKEKQKIIEEAKEEITDLVLLATREVLKEKIDGVKDRELAKSVLSRLRS